MKEKTNYREEYTLPNGIKVTIFGNKELCQAFLSYPNKTSENNKTDTEQ